MAFDLNKLKDVFNQSKEDMYSEINKFIDDFTNIVDSADFEDWLQGQLERTSRRDHRLSFSIGPMWSSSKKGHVFSVGDNGINYYDNSIITMDLPKHLSAEQHKDMQNIWLDAMDECWNILARKLRSLGLSPDGVPLWQITNDTMNYKEVILEILE